MQLAEAGRMLKIDGILPMIGRLPDPLADAIIVPAVGIAGVQTG